jgi:hypothetical protein
VPDHGDAAVVTACQQRQQAFGVCAGQQLHALSRLGPAGELGKDRRGLLCAAQGAHEHPRRVFRDALQSQRRLAGARRALRRQRAPSIVRPAPGAAFEGDGVSDDQQLHARVR